MYWEPIIDQDIESRVVTPVMTKIWGKGLAEMWVLKTKIHKVLNGPGQWQVLNTRNYLNSCVEILALL